MEQLSIVHQPSLPLFRAAAENSSINDGHRRRYESDGFLGKAIVGKADAHVVVVAKDGSVDPLPSMPSRWPAVRTYTEVVVRDESQVQYRSFVAISFGHRLSWACIARLWCVISYGSCF